MDGFQKMVLIIAIILLILLLIIIGVALNYSKNKSWPPITAQCPDYWSIDGSGNNTTCTNVKDLGTCPPSSGQEHLIMNFNQAPYTGPNGLCAKFQWANKCNVSWDGVNYGVNNPCQTAYTGST